MSNLSLSDLPENVWHQILRSLDLADFLNCALVDKATRFHLLQHCSCWNVFLNQIVPLRTLQDHVSKDLLRNTDLRSFTAADLPLETWPPAQQVLANYLNLRRNFGGSRSRLTRLLPKTPSHRENAEQQPSCSNGGSSGLEIITEKASAAPSFTECVRRCFPAMSANGSYEKVYDNCLEWHSNHYAVEFLKAFAGEGGVRTDNWVQVYQISETVVPTRKWSQNPESITEKNHDKPSNKKLTYGSSAPDEKNPAKSDHTPILSQEECPSTSKKSKEDVGTAFAPKLVKQMKLPFQIDSYSSYVVFENWLICAPPHTPDSRELVMVLDLTYNGSSDSTDDNSTVSKQILSIPEDLKARGGGDNGSSNRVCSEQEQFYEIVQSQSKNEVRLIAHNPRVDFEHVYVVKFEKCPKNERQRALEIVQRFKFPHGLNLNFCFHIEHRPYFRPCTSVHYSSNGTSSCLMNIVLDPKDNLVHAHMIKSHVRLGSMDITNEGEVFAISTHDCDRTDFAIIRFENSVTLEEQRQEQGNCAGPIQTYELMPDSTREGSSQVKSSKLLVRAEGSSRFFKSNDDITWTNQVQIRLAHDRRRAIVVVVDYVYLFAYTRTGIEKITSIEFPLHTKEIHIATNQDFFLTCCDLSSFTIHCLCSGNVVKKYDLPDDYDAYAYETKVQTIMMNDHCVLIQWADSLRFDVVQFW